ncbi:hypothetical protein [Rugamonas aquatica]|uniref:Uncharacterized protein n=1 Tax=Rugamonas aquatica TaxID=2743357 RepID=A0A6A7N6J7_9BURK|nr:hypothetical protein [Rugamonas aquatica]MQA40609.1 hypothetical protein [Rugamonas aquatica]
MDRPMEKVLVQTKQVAASLVALDHRIERLQMDSGYEACASGLPPDDFNIVPLQAQAREMRNQLRALLAVDGSPLRALLCCCCNASTLGRHWYALAKGYGLCASCAYSRTAGRSDAEMFCDFGIEGVHYGLCHAPDEGMRSLRPARVLRLLRDALIDARECIRGRQRVDYFEQVISETRLVELPELFYDQQAQSDRLDFAVLLLAGWELREATLAHDALVAGTVCPSGLMDRAAQVAYTELTPAARRYFAERVADTVASPLTGGWQDVSEADRALLIDGGLAWWSGRTLMLTAFGRWAYGVETVANRSRLALGTAGPQDVHAVQEVQ